MEKRLEIIENELAEIEEEIQSLTSRKKDLLKEKRLIESQFSSRKPSFSTQLRNLPEKEYYANKNFQWSTKIQQLALKYWKIQQFRPLQEDIINATLDERDVIVILSTGFGKSLCFQLPALVSPGVSLVISPLISLIMDQVMDLQDRGINALSITGSSSKEEVNRIQQMLTKISKREISSESIKMIYVTPEKIAKSKRFMSVLEKLYTAGLLSRIIVDEAHCCSQFGHDFRPDYKKLGVLKMQFPKTPLIALTATCPAFLLSSIQDILHLKPENCLVFAGSLNRPNLYYSVISKPSSAQKTIKLVCEWILKKYPNQKGIIYCFSKKDSEQFAEGLQKASENKIQCAVYHSDMPDSAKKHTHEQWKKGSLQVVCSTIAFGMGVNHLNVRFVIHHSMSKSIEGYYQESGRAGRDGEPAECLLLYRGVDASRLTSMVYGETEGTRNVHDMMKYCNSLNICRRVLMRDYFGKITSDGQHSGMNLGSWDLQEGSSDQDICQGNCDVCCREEPALEMDCTKLAYAIVAVGAYLRNDFKDKVTINKLVDAYKGRGNLQVKSFEPTPQMVYPAPPELTDYHLERLIIHLILINVLKEEYHYTAYATYSYLLPGPNYVILKRIVEGQKATTKLMERKMNDLKKALIFHYYPKEQKKKKAKKEKKVKKVQQKTVDLISEDDDDEEEENYRFQENDFDQQDFFDIENKPAKPFTSDIMIIPDDEDDIVPLPKKIKQTEPPSPKSSNCYKSNTIEILDNEDDIWEHDFD